MKVSTKKYSKGQVTLSYNEPVSLALRRIFLSLLDIMCSNESGVEKQIESEYLHDYRVAVRRTRSLLGQMRKIFPPDKLHMFRNEFAWLSALTGPARDYDVMLLEFPDYEAMLPDCNPSDFLVLREYLQQQRQQAYARLIEALHSSRYIELKQYWQDFLESDELAEGKGLHRKTRTFCNKHISRSHKTVLSEGKSIGPSSPVEEFHQLRKSCKQLRYLMEMFRDLYPPAIVKRLIKELKKLQDDLGELQDLEVHAEIMQNILGMERNKTGDEHKLKNVIRKLISKMSIRKQAIIENFHEKFSLFASKKIKTLYKELYG